VNNLIGRGKKIFQGSILRTTTVFLQIAIAFFMFPFLIHTLGDKTYGLWVLVMTFMDYYILLRLGFSSAVSRYLSRAIGQNDNTEQSYVASTAFFLYLIISFLMIILTLILFFGVRIFAGEVKNIVLFKTLIIMLGFSTALSPPLSVYRAIINAHLQFKVVECLNIAELVVKNILIYLFIKNGYGLISIAFILLGCRLINSSILVLYKHSHYKNIKINYHYIRKNIFKKLLPYSIYTFIMQLANTLRFKVDALVITLFIGLGLVTHYSIASRLITYFMLSITTFIGVFKIYFSQEEGRGDFDSIREKFFFSTKISTYLSIFIGCSLIFYGKPFILRWMGESYIDSFNLLVILSISSIIALSQYPTGLVLLGISKVKFAAYVNIIEGVLNLVLSILLVHKFGLIGIGLGTAIPMLLMKFTVYPYYISKVLNLNLYNYFKSYLLNFILPLLSLGLYFLVIHKILEPSFKIILTCILGQTIYFGLFIYKLGFNRTEKKYFLNIYRSYRKNNHEKKNSIM